MLNIVSKIGDICISKFHENRIATIIKHIPGHGLARVDSHKKIPIIKLLIASVLLLIIALGYLRFSEGFNPNTEYSPAKYEDGELKPAENK